MDVFFQLTLYLPFLLPRDSKDWGAQPVDYTDGEFQIRIVVLPQEAAKDAPKGVDDMVATPASAPPDITMFQITSIPHRYFYEAMVVAVRGTVANKDALFTPLARVRFFNAAIEATRRFLNFCRAIARDTEIYFSGPDLTLENPTFGGFPHCEGWFDPETGASVGNDKTNICMGEFVVGRSGIKPVPWDRLQSEVRSPSQPRIDVLASLDAQVALVGYDHHKAVLLSAIAIEVAIKSFLRRSGMDDELLKKLEDSVELSFWEKYFDLLLRLAAQPSLKEKIPTLYKRVEILFRVRNKIAHEGICYLEKDGKGVPVRLKHREVSDLVATANHVIDWVDSLATPVSPSYAQSSAP
jgi:hypothetical protein